MIKSITSGAGVSDQSLSRKDHPEDGGHSHRKEGRAGPGSAPGSDTRLVIERDAEGAYCIYKLIDRASGKIVAVLTREQVANLAKGESYAAGSVVRTKA